MIAPELVVLGDPGAVAREAAARVRAAMGEALAARGVASLVLAGGSTPLAAYDELAREPGELDWTRVHLFLGDERAVPPDDDASNFGAARARLLEPLGLPQEGVHRMQGELAPERAARDYEAEVRRWLERHERFDLVLLGVGADGHTASLFPGGPELDERERLVLATRSPEPPRDRISLTLPAIARSRAVLVLVTGAAKREAVRRSLEEGSTPAARARPEGGRAVWLVDLEAAGR